MDYVVQGLVARARRQRPVADDDDDVRLVFRVLLRQRDAEAIGEARAGVARRERVVSALGRLGKAREPAGRADRREPVPPPRHELVGVTLVGRVEDEPILRAVESAVEGECQLDDAEIRGEMSAGPGDGLDDDVAAVLRDLRQLCVVQFLQIRRTFNAA